MGLVSRYVAHMSLRHDGACYLNRRMRCLERHGKVKQRSSYLRLEWGRKDERCRQEEGLSACVRRHALSKWCRVIEIASEVSRIVMNLDRYWRISNERA